MNLRWLKPLALVAALAWSTGPAGAADDYPVRPIKVLMPAAPGTGSDMLGRALAEEVGKRLKQPLVIDNRPGGQGGSVATKVLLASPPDGYTILMHGPAMVTNMLTDANAGYRMEDFIAIAPAGQASLTLAVSPSLSAANLKDALAQLRANPGKLNYGSMGANSLIGMATARFLALTDSKAQGIEYKNANEALLDLMAGRIDLFMQTTPLMAPQVLAGKIRPIAVTSSQRSPQLPDVPTFRELGLRDMFVTSWLVVFAPKATPPAAVERLQRVINEVVASPEYAAKVKAAGFEPLIASGSELQDYLRQEVSLWDADIKRIRAAGR